MEFRTQYTGDTGKFSAGSGTPYLDEYEYRTDKNGVQNLVKKDTKINVYDKIQADYDSTDINKLMLRFSLGEESAINVREGIYADVTKMPTTMAELFDKAGQAQAAFDSLPPEFKEMFNNSASEFYADMNSKGFADKVEEYNSRFDVGDEYEVDEIVEEKGEVADE